MGAVIDTLQSERKIPQHQYLLAKFNLPTNYQTSLIKQNKDALIFEIKIPQVQRVQALWHSICSQKTSSKTKIQITNKIKNSFHNVEKHRYINKYYMIKKIIVCGNTEANLMRILHQMNIKNGYLQIQRGDINISRISGYLKQFQPFNCGSQSTMRLVFEFLGDYTLEDELKLRFQEVIDKTQKISNKHEEIAFLTRKYSFNVNEILRISKFLLQISQEMLQKKCMSQNSYFCFPKISLNDVLLVENSFKNTMHNPIASLKYRNPIQSIFCLGRQPIFNSLNVQQMSTNLQANILSNIGLCILSLCCLEDCFQSCCNFGGQICISAVEQKLQHICKIYEEQNQELFRKIYEMIQSFIFQIIKQQNMSVSQGLSTCNKLLIDLQRKALKIRSDDTTQMLLTEMSTSFTMFNERRKGIFQKKLPRSLTRLPIQQKQKQRYSASFSNPCMVEQNEIGTLKRPCSIDKKLQQTNQKNWIIQQSSQKKMKINDPLVFQTHEWGIETKRPPLKKMDHNVFRYEQIDKKWSQNQDLFKDMPQFEKLQSNILNFPANQFEIQHISRRVSRPIITSLR